MYSFGGKLMERFLWNNFSGTNFMEQFLWNIFYGTIFMEQFLWVRRYGNCNCMDVREDCSGRINSNLWITLKGGKLSVNTWSLVTSVSSVKEFLL